MEGPLKSHFSLSRWPQLFPSLNFHLQSPHLPVALAELVSLPECSTKRKEKTAPRPPPSFWTWLGLGFLVPAPLFTSPWGCKLTDPHSILLGASTPAI